MGEKTVVIAVNAVSGGGKTAVTKLLTDKLENSRALYFDAYDGTDKNVPDIYKWVENGADYDLWDMQEMAGDISRLLGQGLDYIILDYPFSYRQRQIAGFINLSVYIDTPLDIALARRILRDYSMQVRTDSILRELDAYLHTRSAYYYSQACKKDSDLIIDGNLPPDMIADKIAAKVKELK